jgi:hypothetical protein
MLVEKFREFVFETSTFFQRIVDSLAMKYGLPSHKAGENIAMDYNSSDDQVLDSAALCSFRALVYLGDLARYREQLLPTEKGTRRTFESAKKYYTDALSLVPDNGNPHNQLALVSTYLQDDLGATYHYMRSLLTFSPFVTAKDNLALHFDQVIKKLGKGEEADKHSGLASKFLCLVARIYLNTNVENCAADMHVFVNDLVADTVIMGDRKALCQIILCLISLVSLVPERAKYSCNFLVLIVSKLSKVCQSAMDQKNDVLPSLRLALIWLSSDCFTDWLGAAQANPNTDLVTGFKYSLNECCSCLSHLSCSLEPMIGLPSRLTSSSGSVVNLPPVPMPDDLELVGFAPLAHHLEQVFPFLLDHTPKGMGFRGIEALKCLIRTGESAEALATATIAAGLCLSTYQYSSKVVANLRSLSLKRTLAQNNDSLPGNKQKEVSAVIAPVQEKRAPKPVPVVTVESSLSPVVDELKDSMSTQLSFLDEFSHVESIKLSIPSQSSDPWKETPKKKSVSPTTHSNGFLEDLNASSTILSGAQAHQRLSSPPYDLAQSLSQVFADSDSRPISASRTADGHGIHNPRPIKPELSSAVKYNNFAPTTQHVLPSPSNNSEMYAEYGRKIGTTNSLVQSVQPNINSAPLFTQYSTNFPHLVFDGFSSSVKPVRDHLFDSPGDIQKASPGFQERQNYANWLEKSSSTVPSQKEAAHQVAAPSLLSLLTSPSSKQGSPNSPFPAPISPRSIHESSSYRPWSSGSILNPHPENVPNAEPAPAAAPSFMQRAGYYGGPFF